MSGDPNLDAPTGEIKYSAQTLGVNHPTPMAELHKIIMHGMKRPVLPGHDDFSFWMIKATRWKKEADAAKQDGSNREWLYVCCARTAVLIVDKVLRHPDVDIELKSHEKRILQTRGSRMVEAVAVLMEERKAAYEAWEAAERLAKQQIERDLATLHSVLNGGEDKPLPAVPANPPMRRESTTRLQAIQTRVSQVSQPGSPASSTDSPVSGFKSDYLLKGPSRGNSPPTNADTSDPPPPYTEARYEEVMRDIVHDGDDASAPEYEARDGEGDDNSDYHIRVVEPDASSTRAVTPQLSPEIPLPLADEKQKPIGYVGLQSRGRTSSSRTSSVTKGKSPARSRSAHGGTMRVVNPTDSGAEEAGQFAAAEAALDEAYRQLALLRKGGVTARELPRGVTKRIEDLKVFLM